MARKKTKSYPESFRKEAVKLADLPDRSAADEFYDEGQLLPENFSEACHKSGQDLVLRMQQGYDHSYNFISSFVGEHISYHAKALKI